MKDFPLKKNLRERHVRFFAYLFSIFLSLLLLNLGLRFWIFDNQILTGKSRINSNLNYPVLKSSFLPQITANGAIIMDAKTKAILYSKNRDLRFSSASTTKIMTAVVALDKFKPTDIVTIKEATNEGSVIGFLPGQQFTVENLLYAMLLPSANDAALAMAQNYPGGEQAFVDKMNEKAKEFNLDNTHYGDPAGLVDKQSFTTPFDLARLASFALNYKEFAKIVSTKNETISDVAGNLYALENLNKLLGQGGITGVKTGYTEEAGQVLVTSKKEDKNIIIFVVMGSEDRFLDTEKLLSLVSGNLSYLTIHQ